MHVFQPRSHIRRHALGVAVAVLLAIGSGTSALAQLFPSPFQAAPLAQTGPNHPRFAILEIAARIELDAPLGEVEALLAGSARALEINRFDVMGLEVMLVAVPTNDDCLPRGGPLVCSSIRVRLANDPARGMRVSRVEAFEVISGTWTVAEMLRHGGRGLGPSSRTESWGQHIRGMPRAVWRQRWHLEVRESTMFEIIVTAEQPPDTDGMLPDTRSPAAGVGFVLLDSGMEDATMLARRSIIPSGSDAVCN